jgi:hypothetical protein
MIDHSVELSNIVSLHNHDGLVYVHMLRKIIHREPLANTPQSGDPERILDALRSRQSCRTPRLSCFLTTTPQGGPVS